ncbi:MAG: ABC-type multidrug transport system ATPase subunit [Myxococcota bacterium]
MLTSQLEQRFRRSIGESSRSRSRESIVFAVDFTRLLSAILSDQVIDQSAKGALRKSIQARTDLEPDEIDTLLELALSPEARASLSEPDIRAFGARFGAAEEGALRAAVSEELDLQGFSDRYGPAEALLLLDSLFAVCAVDGVVDPQEIGRLTQAAEGLGIDPVLVGALFRKHDVRHESGDFRFELNQDRMTIGRDPSCAITVPDPQVAPRHAELVRSGEGWRIVDLGSGRPTLVGGHAVSSAPFNPGDQLRLGAYTLSLDRTQTTLTAFGSASLSALSVRNLTRKIGKKIVLLDDVSFTVFTGEVIAVVGPSGAGKTTLLNAIAGIAPADSGDVILDRKSFHSLLANDRSLVGIVPQDDVVHPELTVRESLYWSGRLRFPSGTSRARVRKEVQRVLDELDIAHIGDSRVGDAVRRGISGGQRKRANLGQELLTSTTRVLFLDEPTSGLDPQTAQDIVGLVRQLADDGRVAFLVTHDVAPAILKQVDHLMVLARGGRLAWFGPPDDACVYFNVPSADEIFARLPDCEPEEWGRRYRESVAFRTYVRTREHLLGLDGMEPQRAAGTTRVRRSWIRQYLTLTRRYARVKRRDTAGMGVLLLQAPVLAVFMWLVFPAPDPAQLFMLGLSSLWFGASGSVRELIAERTIWRRESRVGVGTLPYLASKVTVLGMLVALQCLVLSGANFVLLQMWNYGFSFFWLYTVTTLTGLVGMALGLLMSALLSSSEAAVGTLPLLLIPQITFGGLIVKVKEMGTAAWLFSWLMVVRYSFEGLIKTGTELTDPARGGNDRVARSISGHLYNLGFKTTASADDMGLPFLLILAILATWLGGLLFWTFVFTWRSRRGN